MRSDFKSATQIYVNPIYFELQLILRNDLFLHENRRNRKNCPKFFHRVIYAFWIQICNPNLCKSHIFWSTANIQKLPKLVKRKNCPKFFHMIFFTFWIQICNQNLCKYHTFWNTVNIEKWSFFAFQDLMTKIDEIGNIARNSFIG